MKKSKIVDDIKIPLELEETDKTRFCFVVFSSKEEHIEIVIDCVERVIKEKENYEVKRLDNSLKSEDSQYKELTDLLSGCSFGVIILDGLRPNVLFEYGILKGLGKPCIVLLEEKANVDVINYFPEDKDIEIKNPKVDMDKHFSDIKDRFYVRYNKNRPKEIRDKIKKEYSKLKKDIDDEFIRMIFPRKDIVEKELKDHSVKLIEISKKKKDELNSEDETEIRLVMKKIDGIVKEYKIKLPKFYYINIAQILSDFGKFEDALKIIDPIIENKKEDIYLIGMKAIILAQLKRFDSALETIDIGLKLKPDTETLWHHKGMILEQMGKKDEAKLCYKKGIEFEHSCPEIHFLYGLLLYDDDQFTEALDQFNKALEKESTKDKYLVWKARTLNELGKTEEAKKVVEDALCFNDKNPNAWYTLGQLTSDFKESIKHFEKTLSIDPDHYGAHCCKAAALSNIGKSDEAMEIFNKMKDVCPESKTCDTIFYNIGNTLMQKKQFSEALNYINRALELNDKYSKTLVIKAQILLGLGKEDESLKVFKNAIKLDPNDANTWYNQSCAFAKLNKIDGSIESLKKAIELDSSYKDLIDKDSDFDGIRNNKKFKKEFG